MEMRIYVPEVLLNVIRWSYRILKTYLHIFYRKSVLDPLPLAIDRTIFYCERGQGFAG